jgi:predicted nucleic acid-binding protein
MNLVVDANVLVGELLRNRGRKLIQNRQLKIYIAQKALSETYYELNRRLTIMNHQNKLTELTKQQLLDITNQLIESYIIPVLDSVYLTYETDAKKRISRDPNDWETVALALALPAAIWTEDYDFFGCGCAVWTTETLLLQII